MHSSGRCQTEYLKAKVFKEPKPLKRCMTRKDLKTLHPFNLNSA